MKRPSAAQPALAQDSAGDGFSAGSSFASSPSSQLVKRAALCGHGWIPSVLDLEPGNPDNPGRALADFFRLEDGKVVEHWDVIQDVPKTAANGNGMF
ncbi:nuclear transport factor 2 family protein [Amycolatopsis sp. NBC_01480]|uniref:nuclear transport factor 2 family protein n=1 Tax=Amycolatopsis sp. NBC_01480 TaxID=2903562 RepID=UPI002E2A43A2|nr:hypothetical protein [Amycolatopsis sp. NBC_01480]